MSFVTGGCDNCVRLWTVESGKEFGFSASEVGVHNDWVRDLAWLKSSNSLVSCSEDKTVVQWNRTENGEWKNNQVESFNSPVWRVSASEDGIYLSVTEGDNLTTVLIRNKNGCWERIAKTNDGGNVDLINN